MTCDIMKTLHQQLCCSQNNGKKKSPKVFSTDAAILGLTTQCNSYRHKVDDAKYGVPEGDQDWL
jgi:hypothetical protein